MKRELFRRTRARVATAIAMACVVSMTATGAAVADTTPSEHGKLAQQQIEVLLADALEAVGETEASLVEPSLRVGNLEFKTDGGTVLVQESTQDQSLIVESAGPGQNTGFGLPVEATAADGEILADGTALFSDDHVDLALQAHEDGSVRAQTIIRDEASPREFGYELDLPEGAYAEIAEDGGVDVFQTFPDETEAVLASRFEPAWAVDAKGLPVRTWYELRDKTLVQVVEHGKDSAYPVVADPFWIPAIVVVLRVASVVVKVGSKTVKYTKAPASRVVNALSSFQTLSFRTGSHTFKLDKSAMKHILERHHPQYWNGTSKTQQTFFNPNMSVNDVRNLVHGAMKQWPNTLKSRGTNARIELNGTYNNVNYKMVIDKGRVVQFYPR